MDEDYVKKCMNITHHAHGATREISTLQNWLLLWPENLQKAERAERAF